MNIHYFDLRRYVIIGLDVQTIVGDLLGGFL